MLQKLKKYEAILNILREDADISMKEISKKTGIPITTIHNRIKAMKKEGIIKCYRAIIDPKKLGYNVQAFVQLAVKGLDDEKIKKIISLPNVVECYTVSGPHNVILKVYAETIEALNNFVDSQLRSKDWVGEVIIEIVMNVMKE
ncbi:MAG: winged helix-turn-helix transcriptional regulator [Candidatus Aenigmatarchaeota archaeon]|nr:Lrp/AsnC family transcriptional regulator [Candidatus Aenigmarchaeota archaeon]